MLRARLLTLPPRLLAATPLALILLACALLAPAAAHGYPTSFPRVAHNPADALASLPIERFAYDPATHCVKRPAPGRARAAGMADPPRARRQLGDHAL